MHARARTGAALITRRRLLLLGTFIMDPQKCKTTHGRIFPQLPSRRSRHDAAVAPTDATLFGFFSAQLARREQANKLTAGRTLAHLLVKSLCVCEHININISMKRAELQIVVVFHFVWCGSTLERPRLK